MSVSAIWGSRRKRGLPFGPRGPSSHRLAISPIVAQDALLRSECSLVGARRVSTCPEAPVLSPQQDEDASCNGEDRQDHADAANPKKLC